MIWLVVGGIVSAWVALSFAIGAMAAGLFRAAANPEPVFVIRRCECRRHAFPSPLCSIHGEVVD